MKENAVNEKEKLKRGYLHLLFQILMVAVVLAVIFGVVCRLWRVQGQDMYPAVRDGDLLLALRLNKTWERNDVVIYQAEGKRRVGRIVAAETDRISVSEDGNLMVNGFRQNGDIFFLTEMESEDPVVVPEGTVYILGDHRIDCHDSREFGPIPVMALEGKVIGLYRRRGF